MKFLIPCTTSHYTNEKTEVQSSGPWLAWDQWVEESAFELRTVSLQSLDCFYFSSLLLCLVIFFLWAKPCSLPGELGKDLISESLKVLWLGNEGPQNPGKWLNQQSYRGTGSVRLGCLLGSCSCIAVFSKQIFSSQQLLFQEAMTQCMWTADLSPGRDEGCFSPRAAVSAETSVLRVWSADWRPLHLLGAC